MFESMPESLKLEVLKFLEDDDFPAAKQVYDRWHLEKNHPKPQTTH